MKKSFSIIILTFLFIMLIRLFGVTYGYFSTRIIENTNNSSLDVSAKYLSVVYEDGDAIMNFSGDYLFPADTAEKSFTVTNTGTDTATYNILIEDVINEFERTQDLRYDLYIDDELVVDNAAINNNEVQYLLFGRSINVGDKDIIKMIFTYAETEEIQNMDMNKGISFKFNIDSSLYCVETSSTNSVSFIANEGYLNSYRIYGNSLQDGTPSIESPVDIQSVGNLVTDETDENYGKYKIPITVKGKNLFNIDKAVDKSALVKNEDGSYSLWYTEGGDRFANAIAVDLKANNTYVMSYDLIETNSTYSAKIQFVVTYSDSTSSTLGVSKGTKFTPKKNVAYLQLYQEGAMPKGTYTTFKNFQIEESTTATEYEPYVVPIITNIYLDEPLRKVGDNADYIDFGRQMLVRKIASKVFNGNEYWILDSTVNQNGFQTHINYSGNLSLESSKVNVLSNMLKARTWNSLWQNYYQTTGSTNLSTGIAIQFNSTYKELYFKLTPYSTMPTVAEWKEQLAEWYANGIPLMVWYVSPAVESPIKLPSILINKGTNIFEVNTEVQPSSMEIEVLK